MNLFSYKAQYNHYKQKKLPSLQFIKLNEFYENRFITFFGRKHLINTLEEKGFKSFDVWRKGGRKGLDEKFLKALLNTIDPHYTNIINRVADMMEKPLETDYVDGIYTGVVFKIIRFQKIKDDVQVSIRRNHKKEADITNDEDWSNVKIEEIIEDGFLKLIHDVLNKKSEEVIKILFSVATLLEFHIDETLKVRDLMCSALADIDIPIQQFNTYNPMMLYTNHDDEDDEYRIHINSVRKKIKNLSSFFLLMAIHDHKWYESKTLQCRTNIKVAYPSIQNNKVLSLEKFVDEMFCFDQNRMAEEAYDIVMKHRGRMLYYDNYDSYDNSKKIERLIFLRNQKDMIALFGEDKNKLIFLFSIIFNLRKNLSVVDSDYFSYKNLVSKNPLKLDWLVFPSKAVMRSFFNLDAELLSQLVSLGGRDGDSNSETLWRNIMYFLQYSPMHEILTVGSLSRAHKHISILCNRVPRIENDLETSKKIGKIVEIMLCLASTGREDSIVEYMDYIHGDKYQLNAEGKLVKGDEKNIVDVNKKMSLKHASKLQSEWHLRIYQYALQGGRKDDNFIDGQYDGLRTARATIKGVRFKVITNRIYLRYESILLKHCVIDYHERIKSNDYIVIEVTDNKKGKERTSQNAYTMGCHVIGYDGIKLDQIKGLRNAKAPKHIHDAAKIFIEKCNAGNIKLWNDYED